MLKSCFSAALSTVGPQVMFFFFNWSWELNQSYTCVLQNIGCDYVIDSGAVEDRCGVCHGNGSTCTTVKKTFEESEGIGEICFITHYDSGLFTGDLLIPWFPLLFCSPPPSSPASIMQIGLLCNPMTCMSPLNVWKVKTLWYQKNKKKEKPVLNKNTFPDQYNLKTKPMLSIHEVPPPPSFPPILGTTVWTLL